MSIPAKVQLSRTRNAIILPSAFLMSHQAIDMKEVKNWRCSSLTNTGTNSVNYKSVVLHMWQPR